MTAFLTGVGLTPFGRQPGRDSLDWQCTAAGMALDDAGLGPDRVGAVIAGYSTVANHLMPANLAAERLGIRPDVAFGMSVGGATGLAMVAQAVALVRSAAAEHVLVVAGENRASGQARTTSTTVLAQVGHAAYEVPLGGNVPAYYALLASRYLWSHGLDDGALAALPVQMREHAVGTAGAHFREPITVADVLASRPVAEPLRLLDCCPVSDGGAAFVISRAPVSERSLQIAGVGQAHRHQHLSELDPDDTGASRAAGIALGEAGMDLGGVHVWGIYDSFSITVAMIVEELGLAPPGCAGAYAQAGAFQADGRYPLNTHGGLLSYGHSGVAGGMAHLAEVAGQLRGERGVAQVRNCEAGYVHADGGVLSAHVGVVLRKASRS
ncbi:thiolase family protein [Blastococcus sp. VKM Ac-2987]|uniref:thiolase family protein n=1 Tax=Blastococcus sp. VKM Ac-2987 TaxID=3004141 RepID=UPI0022AB6AE4|nr:thiolase family protein [Blastococcus sp. VKM Ac-2987]MCZ2859878.1 thiolase family protein [Blastococcus sp. VKM Ac-2987]